MKTKTTTTHTAQDVTNVDGGQAKVTCEITVDHYDYSYNDRKTRNAKTRVFWNDQFNLSNVSEEFVLGVQPEITVRGEFPEIDKAWDRYNKQHLRIVREAIVKTLNEMCGYAYKVKGSDVRYSRNAGCSMCPCSPGFILSNEVKEALTFACRAEAGITTVWVNVRYHAAA